MDSGVLPWDCPRGRRKESCRRRLVTEGDVGLGGGRRPSRTRRRRSFGVTTNEGRSTRGSFSRDLCSERSVDPHIGARGALTSVSSSDSGVGLYGCGWGSVGSCLSQRTTRTEETPSREAGGGPLRGNRRDTIRHTGRFYSRRSVIRGSVPLELDEESPGTVHLQQDLVDTPGPTDVLSTSPSTQSLPHLHFVPSTTVRWRRPGRRRRSSARGVWRVPLRPTPVELKSDHSGSRPEDWVSWHSALSARQTR